MGPQQLLLEKNSNIFSKNNNLFFPFLPSWLCPGFMSCILDKISFGIDIFPLYFYLHVSEWFWFQLPKYGGKNTESGNSAHKLIPSLYIFLLKVEAPLQFNLRECLRSSSLCNKSLRDGEAGTQVFKSIMDGKHSSERVKSENSSHIKTWLV